MSQGVTYADLRFVRTPPEKSQEKDPSEGELTYENIQGPPCQEKRTPTPTEATKESDHRTWYAILALLAACLFLLTAAIGLGVRYWQVSRQLQQATEDGSALERRMGSQEGSLAQTQAQLEEAQEELHSTNRTLWNCLAAGNRTQEQLREANQSLTLTQKEKEKLQQEKEELQRDKKELEEEKKQQQEDKARLQEEKETVQQQLEEMGGKLELLITCQQKDCCPRGWKFFGWKCLRISREMKSWWDSQNACKSESSQLLVLKPWSAKELWDATFIDKKTQYWIGLKKVRQPESWKWVDGTGYEGTEHIGTCRDTGYCIQMSRGALEECSCWNVKRFICEKEASPDQPL
ncbi:B-cell differentiation antigen CD72-like [Podarcis raffonei]|uniref:B-cell differentiation antigen CD72-like n=1 Tax=Podarcis raffonei TaxID=65483 RepID=UPI0023293DFE|nr:B-cell differentiation antigen CD72-like [Podarcis raffonei]